MPRTTAVYHPPIREYRIKQVGDHWITYQVQCRVGGHFVNDVDGKSLPDFNTEQGAAHFIAEAKREEREI